MLVLPGAGVVLNMWFTLLMTVGVLAPSSHGPKSLQGVEGIWKKCFEPGLPGVTEIADGYLVLMPELRYYEASEDCCFEGDGPEPPYWEVGDYRIVSDGVVLTRRNYRGEQYETRYRLLEAAEAVFWDDPQGEPVAVDALSAGSDLNYGWCRVYPAPRP